MDINKRSRNELKSYFVKNAIPTESNFADLIEAPLNQKDDGVVKLPGDPLSIEASGEAGSQKKALHLYNSFSDDNPAWVISLNPRSNPTDPKTARPGFNIGDATGNSRLFIDSATGRIGIGTINPRPSIQIGDRGAISYGSGWANIGSNAYYDGQWAQIDAVQPGVNLHMQAVDDGQEFRFYRMEAGGQSSRNVAIIGSKKSFFTSPVDVNSNLTVTGQGRIIGGLRVDGNVGHINTDGAIYRAGGQVYITVDDNLYIRDSSGSVPIHIDTNNGRIGIGKTSPGAALDIGGVDPGEQGVVVSGKVGNSHIPWTDGSVYLSGTISGSQKGNFIFRTYDGSNYANKLVVDGKSGRVSGLVDGPGGGLYRIAMGKTTAGNTPWVQYNADGILLDVDTSSAGFSSTPYYFTSLGGTGSHWTTQGATSIYNPSATKFRVYVNQGGITPAKANQWQWHIQWIAIGT